MFSARHQRLSCGPYAGLAAATIEIRVLRAVVVPAWAIETVCCSTTRGRQGGEGRSMRRV